MPMALPMLLFGSIQQSTALAKKIVVYLAS
jgi:hypothetical protein